MTMEGITPAGPEATPPPPVSGWRRGLRNAENSVVVTCLVAMVLLPLVEATLRRLLHTGVSSAATIVQHCGLVLSMMGGAIAARDDRLLALSTLGRFLTGRARPVARLLSHAVGATITAVLCLAAWRFMLQERAGGNMLAYGVKRWVVEASMPLGFGLIALRLWWRAADGWKGRAVAGGLVVLIVVLGAWPPLPAAHLVLPALLLLLVTTMLGAPVFVALGGAAVILYWGVSQPLTALPIEHYGLVVNATLPTIPLFTLAGYFLAEGGASRRLVRVCNALVGHWRGGPAIITALTCAFFTSFTGASGVTIIALGGLLMPVLLAARFSERNALGLLTGAGSLGLLFPPCLPLILYAIVAKVRIEDMFLGGILPGVVLVLLTIALGIMQGPKDESLRPPFRWREAVAGLWEAKWELALPVVAIGALFGGFATPVEAAALTAFYAFVVEVFIYRDLAIVRDAPRVMTECALLVGGVFLILGVALGLTDYLIESETPDRLLELARTSIHSQWVFLLCLNLFLLVVGGLMEIFAAIVVVVPLIVPLGVAFGVQPIHLGIIFLANLELGFLMPPAGMNLLLSSYRFNKSVPEVCRSILPILTVLLIGVLLITYVPALTTWLPALFGSQ